MPRYLVETVSIFRMRYVVEAKEPGHAKDTVYMTEAKEFSQQHIDENILSVREVSDEEISRLFFEDHPYLVSWSIDKPDKVFDCITKIEY